jgi:hypothetical protein
VGAIARCKFSAGHQIRQHIVLEAKRMGRYSGAGMKEIAYDLGFADFWCRILSLDSVTQTHLKLEFISAIESVPSKCDECDV